MRLRTPIRGLRLHRPRSPTRARAAATPPMRVSDLILAVLGVSMLGGLALMAACSLTTGT
ncbi:hypothetical protein HCU64_12615 [Methylobacterium sp. C25]|uniref:hypothetical protein n=1 Tax=Methylobacterium sp. C25 TaxID=2721622 RepID=UPI001F2D88DF|nr:hypothetical protein [Methylobacterium sp. C25]MCE4224600.1 hypothetical protein [Methylobacterium sp. C25]